MDTDHQQAVIMTELVDGTHYLVNYYKFFGVDPETLAEADQQGAEEQLKSAYRELNLHYHPDRYSHLAPAMKAQATQVHLSIQRGYDILTHPERRKAYDKQLADWKGPISENGFPVCDWKFLEQLGSKPLTDAEITAAKDSLRGITGYNPNTQQLIKRLVAADKTGDYELREALDQSFEQEEIFLMIEEKLHLELAGVEDRQLVEVALPGYVDQVRARIEQQRAQIPEQVSKLLLAAREGRLFLTGPDGEDRTQMYLAKPDESVISMSQAFLKALDDAAPKLEDLARRREAIFQERLVLSMQYRPKQKKLRPKLALYINSPKAKTWRAYELFGDQVRELTSMRAHLLGLEEPAEARCWIKRGWSILVITPREQLDFFAYLQAVVEMHFLGYLDQEAAKE